MSEYTIHIASIDKPSTTYNGDPTARGTIIIDDTTFRWTLYSTTRHQYDVGHDDRQGHWEVLIPAVALRTNPLKWRKHRDAKKIRAAIEDAVDKEHARRYHESQRAEALAAGLPWPPPPNPSTDEEIPF